MKSLPILFILVVVCLAVAVEAQTTKKPATAATTTSKTTARTTTSSVKPTTSKTTVKPTTTTKSKSTTSKKMTTAKPSSSTTVRTTSTKPATTTTTAKRTTAKTTTSVKTTARTTTSLKPSTTSRTTSVTTTFSPSTTTAKKSTVVSTTKPTTATTSHKTTAGTTPGIPSTTSTKSSSTLSSSSTTKGCSGSFSSTTLVPPTTARTTAAPTTSTVTSTLSSSTASSETTTATAASSTLWTTRKITTTIPSPVLFNCTVSDPACGNMCGDVTSTTTGVVQSPNFPGDYGSNEERECQVTITAPAGWMIQLNFTTFNLETGIAAVFVYDEYTSLLPPITGNAIPAVVTTSTNVMHIIFGYYPSTKPTSAIYNWQATFTAVTYTSQGSYCSVNNPAVCGNMCANLTSVGGVVQSPNFPADYGNEKRVCIVTITAPAGWMINLNFTDFNLETDVAYLQVGDGFTFLLPLTTGNTIPAVVPAIVDFVKIVFICPASNKSSTAIYNWQATFSMTSQGSYCYVDNPACGNMCHNVTSAGTGVVQSPNFPADYGNEYKYCLISIIVPAGMRIRLNFTTFNVETGKGVIHVWFRETLYLDWVTGSAIPAVVTTTANMVYVLFLNQHESTKPSPAIYKWRATYTATPSPVLFNCTVSDPACGNMCTNLTLTGGIVQSPNFPGDYGNEQRGCVVVITAPEEWLVQLNFTTFNVETGVCFVYVFNVFLLYNAGTIPPAVLTTTDSMVIGFGCANSTKPSTAVYNWQATLSVTSQESSCSVSDLDFIYSGRFIQACENMCTDVTSSGSGVVQSPNFPNDYGNNSMFCKVTIIVPVGKSIRLNFTTLNLETDYGYLYVEDRKTTYLSVVTGSTIPAVVITKSNSVFITFRKSASTNPNTAMYNWRGTYTAITRPETFCSASDQECKKMCTNATSTGTNVVQSPNFPDDYGNRKKYCEVTIEVPVGKKIRLTFTTFNLETDVGYIKVYDSNTLYLYWSTGSTIPSGFTTASNLVYLGFYSYASNKSSTAIYNWQATFSATSQENSCSVSYPECGNMCPFATSAGTNVVQSPNFPDDYGNEKKYCNVTIIVPEGKRIRLEFTDFNLETGKAAISVDYNLTVYLNWASGSTIPAVITTKSNKVYVGFATIPSTKPNPQLYNWRATYTAV